MASPLDALSFREMYGRTLHRPDRGTEHAFIVTPFTAGMTPRDQDKMMQIVRHSMYRCIDYGEIFYVSSEMTAFLQRIVDEQMQNRTIFRIEQGDIPSLTGFVYFDGQIKLPTIYGKDGFQNLRAILWDQFAAGPPQRGLDTVRLNKADRPGLYFGGSEGNEDMEVIGKVIYTVCDTPNAEQRDRYGPWKPRHWIPAVYGERYDAEMINNQNSPPEYSQPLSAFDEAQDKQDSINALNTVHRILTAWTRVIQTEIPIRHPADPAHDKVMAREGRPPAIVKITQLRRYADQTTPGTGQVEVDWAYRWEVRGHYRWQRVGPGRQFLRRVWIKEHINGPPDKPLVHRDSITALVR